MGQNASVPRNYEVAFAERPEVYAAWVQLNGAIKALQYRAVQSLKRLLPAELVL